MAQKLDDKTVKTLPAPPTGNKLYYDSEVKGFACRVTAAGIKAFVFNYRAGGFERRITIGQFPAWSATAARKHAGDLRQSIDRGDDPMAARHAERAAPTVGDLIDRFEADFLPKKRESTAAEYRSILENLARPALGRMKVADLRHADIDKLHREVSAKAPYRANRMAAVLSKMMGYAIKLEWSDKNPVRGIERNQEDRRSRYLSDEELGCLSAALQEHRQQKQANAVRLLILTGARRMEVLAATWDMFDLEQGIWVKPSAHTKQKKEHRVPLSAAAAKLLAGMKEAAKGSKYLFPTDRPTTQAGDGDAHISDLKKFWAAIIQRATVLLWARKPDIPAGALVAELTVDGKLPTYNEAVKTAKTQAITLPAGLTDTRLHDLRHTYASVLVSAGLSLPIIGALLGHTQPATTARYAHINDDPLRAATERVGSRFQGLSEGKSAQVTNLAAARAKRGA